MANAIAPGDCVDRRQEYEMRDVAIVKGKCKYQWSAPKHRTQPTNIELHPAHKKNEASNEVSEPEPELTKPYVFFIVLSTMRLHTATKKLQFSFSWFKYGIGTIVRRDNPAKPYWLR